jgi:thioredoxin-like negative regulator of GroEL
MSVHTLPDAAAAGRQSKLIIDLATSELRAGNGNEAQRLLRDHLLKSPRDADALVKLAEIAEENFRSEEAAVLLRRAADADPTAARFTALLRHLQARVGAAAVLAELDRVPPALRHEFDIMVEEVVALDALSHNDREIAVLEELSRTAPDNTDVWITLGEALGAVGRRDEALEAVREALRRKPSCGAAYWALANFKAFRFSDADVSAMRKALKRNPAAGDQITLNFALGRALEDRGLHQQSFRHYAAGNQLHAAGLDPSTTGCSAFVNAGIATLTPAFFEERAGWGCRDPSPVFVVGMHRAGSTLVDQILASHPEIEGTTEIKVLETMWNRLWRRGIANGRHVFHELASLDAGEIAALGEEYVERTRAFRTTTRPFFVDKMPPNWMRLGLIRLALPNAKIIDARRHPMACGFSNFKQHYRRDDNPFASSLETIGTFYRDYWRFVANFERAQPGAVHRVTNETLIADPEGEIRRMLDFIGVPFDAACLEFHKNKRAVRTPSAEQVRRPINRDGVDAWKNYEPWLGPLKAALGPALDHWNE